MRGLAIMTPVALCQESGVSPSLRECLKMCIRQGLMESQHSVIIDIRIWSGPGALFFGREKQTLWSLSGEIIWSIRAGLWVVGLG